MTRTFSDGHPKVLPACNFFSQYYFYNIFLQKSCRFSLQTLTKFEAAKTGSGVGFLRLTAVCLFASFKRSKSALCHLLFEATCSLRTDKQLGNNVTSVDEYSKIVTAQQLGDRIVHIFLRIRHISRLKYNRRIEKTH